MIHMGATPTMLMLKWCKQRTIVIGFGIGVAIGIAVTIAVAIVLRAATTTNAMTAVTERAEHPTTSEMVLPYSLTHSRMAI